MSAAYDTYDYPSYWESREYEHKSEVMALSSLLSKIPKLNSIIEIGAGYGRLTPVYLYRGEKIILSDPSSKLLNLAKKNIKNLPAGQAGKKVTFIQLKLENLSRKLKNKSADLVILIRVLHHLQDFDKALAVIKKITKKNSYFILEFANKRHLKALVNEFFKGNFTFLLDIFPKDISSKKRRHDLPFINYHPDLVKRKLKENGFKILEVRSVSNIRSPILKKIIPLEVLLFIEKYAQKLLASINFGPSIFILSKKI